MHKNGNSNVAISKMLNMFRQTVWNVIKRFQALGNLINCAKNRKNFRKRFRNYEFVKIQRDPKKKKKMSKSIEFSKRSLRRILKNHSKHKSYKLGFNYYLFEKMKLNCLIKCRK